MRYLPHERSCGGPLLHQLSLAPGVHRPRRVALLSLRAQLAGRGGAAGRARGARHRRDDPQVVPPPIRSGLREQVHRRRPRPGDTWHLDEVFMRSNGATHYPWRAVAQDGIVRNILVRSRRDAAVLPQAAQAVVGCPTRRDHRQARELWRGQAGQPAEGGASAASGAQQPRRAGPPTHVGARAADAPPHVAAYGPIAGHCRPHHHHLTATYRRTRDHRFATWREVTGAAAA